MLQGQASYGTHRAQDNDGVLAVGRNLYPMLPEDAFDRGPQSRSAFRLVADVRLDNRPEIAAGLGLGSADGARMPDAALLFEALLRWGDDAVNRFVGEFAFAFWDGAKQELLLGRDILGLRPLCYHQGKDFFAFATMPSGLHALQDVPYDFDPEFMAERLAMLPQLGSKSYFRGIHRVEPAHLLRVTRDGVRSHKYWRPPAPSATARSPGEYEEGLRSVIDQAVAANLRGAGNIVASHLSSGLDSSTVTATAARLHPHCKVIAFTAVPRPGFAGPIPPETIANEGELAAATARLYPNIEHVLIEGSAGSPLEGLDRNFLYHQQPVANLSNFVWGRAINRAARDRGANTLLKGALGNLSASYSGLEWLPYLLARRRLVRLTRQASQLARNGMPLLSIGARMFGPFIPGRLWMALRQLRGRTAGPMDYSAVSRAHLTELQAKGEARGFDLAGRPRNDPYENRMWAYSQADGGNSIKGILAEYGLSVRDPMGDKRVIEFSLATPFEEFVRGGVPRSLARRAFADRLPPEVAMAKVRGYQAADWYEGLDRSRAQVAEEVASIAKCADAADPLDVNWLEQAVNSWPEGGSWGRDEIRTRYRLGLLRGISAGHFMRKVRGTN